MSAFEKIAFYKLVSADKLERITQRGAVQTSGIRKWRRTRVSKQRKRIDELVLPVAHREDKKQDNEFKEEIGSSSVPKRSQDGMTRNDAKSLLLEYL